MGTFLKFGILGLIVALFATYFLYYYVLFPRLIIYELKKKFDKKSPQSEMQSTDRDYLLSQIESMRIISKLKPFDYGIIQVKDTSSFLLLNADKIELILRNDSNLSPIHDSSKLYNFIKKSFTNDIDADFIFRSNDLIVIKKINEANLYLYFKFVTVFAKLK